MIKFDEDIHCRACAGRGEHPRIEGDWCPECNGTGYKEVQVGYGPMSVMAHLILPGVLPAPPGRPYMAPVQTACHRRLSGLMQVSWRQPEAALDLVDCTRCNELIREILSA